MKHQYLGVAERTTPKSKGGQITLGFDGNVTEIPPVDFEMEKLFH